MQGFETQRPQGQLQRPQNFQVEQTNPGNLKRKRVYQDWIGSEKFFCGGRVVGGPGWKTSFLTALVVLVPTVLFLVFVAWPLRDLNIAIFIVGVVLTILSEVFLFITAFTEPGVIPRQPPDNEGRQGLKPSTKEVTVNDQIVVIRYNATCNFYQPPRAHHCSVNDNCIERFDHHCPWIGTTIGQRNYRTFLLFVLTSTVLCLYVMAFCVIYGVSRGYRWGSVLNEQGRTERKPIEVVRFENVAWAMALFIVGIICFLFVGCLSAFHCWLVAKNQTTYENFRYASANRPNPYDRGCFRNCAEVWCLRIQPSHIQARRYLDDMESPTTDLPINMYLRPPFSNYFTELVTKDQGGLIPTGQRPSKLPSKITEEQSQEVITGRTANQSTPTNTGQSPVNGHQGSGKNGRDQGQKSPVMGGRQQIDSKILQGKRQKPDELGQEPINRINPMPKVGTKSVLNDQEYRQQQQNQYGNGMVRDVYQSPPNDGPKNSNLDFSKNQKHHMQRDLDKRMLGQTQQKQQVAQQQNKLKQQQGSNQVYNNGSNQQQQQQYFPPGGSNTSSRHSSQDPAINPYPVGPRKRTSGSDVSSKQTQHSNQPRNSRYPSQIDEDQQYELNPNTNPNRIGSQGELVVDYNDPKGTYNYTRPNKRATKTGQQQTQPKNQQQSLSLQDIQLMSDEIHSTNQVDNMNVKTTNSQQERLRQLARRQKEKRTQNTSDDEYPGGNIEKRKHSRDEVLSNALHSGGSNNTFQEVNDNSVSHDIKRISGSINRNRDYQGSAYMQQQQAENVVMQSLDSNTTQSNDARDSNMLLPKQQAQNKDVYRNYQQQSPVYLDQQQGIQQGYDRGNGSRGYQDDKMQYPGQYTSNQDNQGQAKAGRRQQDYGYSIQDRDYRRKRDYTQ